MVRIFAMLGLMAVVAGCSGAPADLALPAEPMGEFKLGHAEVVAPKLEKLLVSRDATPEEWTTVMDAAVEERFRRFDGTQFYHLGISVEAFSLPPPVVPGKSALAIRVTAWDDAAGKKLNEKTELIHVIQVFESRLNLTREQQMERLAQSASVEIEKWLRAQHEEKGWFAKPVPPLDEV